MYAGERQLEALLHNADAIGRQESSRRLVGSQEIFPLAPL
jgi:hypothetical protein